MSNCVENKSESDSQDSKTEAEKLKEAANEFFKSKSSAKYYNLNWTNRILILYSSR